MSIWSDPNSYQYVTLTNLGRECRRSVHQLVASAFIGVMPDGLEINHLDGDKHNNRSDNLEYVTRSENHLHAYRIGLQKPTNGEINGNTKLTKEDVRAIRRRLGGEFQREIAKDFGVTQANISCIACSKSWRWLD